jgi:CheY-like chemotaxis protein
MQKILVATRDEHLTKSAKTALAGHKYTLSVVAPGKALVDSLRNATPDVVVLGGVALAELKRIRTTSPRTAVITVHKRPAAGHLTAPPALVDDFVMEPFAPGELKVRVDRVLRKGRVAPATPEPAAAIDVGRDLLLPEVHDRRTGRLDAKLLAEYSGIALSDLAQAIGKGYKAVFKSPSSAPLQPLLKPIQSMLVALRRVYPDRKSVRAWLNTPHPSLRGKQPIELVLEGKAEVIADLLNATLAGVPT